MSESLKIAVCVSIIFMAYDTCSIAKSLKTIANKPAQPIVQPITIEFRQDPMWMVVGDSMVLLIPDSVKRLKVGNQNQRYVDGFNQKP